MLRPRRARGDDALYARATPQKIKLTETYTVDQEISRNPTLQQADAGTGRVEVRVPYDGREYFTRQAVADVEAVLRARGGGGEQRVTIGHLLCADHTRTAGLGNLMRPHNHAGVVPLSILARTDGGDLDLTGDRQACVITYEYLVHKPEIYRIDLTVEMDDLDSLMGAFGGAQTLMDLGRDNPSWVIEKLRQKASFSSKLWLTLMVKVAIPVKEGYRGLNPIVKTMSVEWPTLTSLRSTKLHVEDFWKRSGQRFQKAPVRYNPVAGRLEWRNVPMQELPAAPGQRADRKMFRSAIVLLEVGHPGELFKEDRLEVEARVEIPHYLLSGLEARLFDATGRSQARQPEMVTRLETCTQVYPADVFARRTFSPYQQFVFDDIIPDESRVTDIMTALRNAKFEVEPPQAQPDPVAPTWLLRARRSQGPDTMGLLVAVEGRRAVLDREQIMDPSVKLKGSKESGQLKISVLGSLPGDHKELTREMNALQQALRDLFRFHQMSRK